MRLLKSLKWYDVAVVIGGLFVLAYLQVQRPPNPVAIEAPADIDVVMFSSVTEIVPVHSQLPKTEKTTAQYKSWSGKARYFGAFAISPAEAYGWTENYNSLSEARVAALALCEEWDRNCKVVAVATPEGFEAQDGFTLSAEAATAFRTYLGKNAPKAVAASASGFLTWTSERETRQQAEDVVMERCKKKSDAYAEDKPLKASQCYILRSEDP